MSAPVVAAGELVAAGRCSPPCLLAMGEERNGCRCRCAGEHHGALRAAEVGLRTDPARQHDLWHPPVVVPVVRPDGWQLRCPFCFGKHLHGATAGRRASHCGREDYVLAPPWAVLAPYGDCCPRCRDYYTLWTPFEIDQLKSVRPTARALSTFGTGVGDVTAYYRCAVDHEWSTTYDDASWAMAHGGRWTGTKWLAR